VAGISSNVYSGPYDADGAQTAFPFTFSIATENEAAVEMDGLPVSPDLYRVTFDNAGGTVTFLTPPALHAQILLRSNPDYLQTSSFENEGSYNLDTVNLINRRATIRDLVTKEMADRALKVPPGALAPDLPSLIDSDGMVLSVADGRLRWIANDNASAEDAAARAEAAAAGAAAQAILADTARIRVEAIAGTGVGRVFESWAALSAVTGAADDGAVVIDADGGAHADPIVGGTVANAGVFRYVVGTPHGWKRIANTLALDASLSAATATAAAASATSALARVDPAHANEHCALIQGCAVNSATTNADNTVTLNGTTASFSFLPTPAFLAARAAGSVVTFVFERVSGSALTTAPVLYRKAGFTNLHADTMTLNSYGEYSISFVIDATCDSIQIVAASAGSTIMKMPGFAPLQPARAHSDAKLLATEGFQRSKIDTILPISYTVSPTGLSGGSTYSNGSFTIPPGGGGGIDLLSPLAITDGGYGVVSFESNMPLGNVINSLSTIYSSGHTGAPITTPAFEQIGETLYQIVFDVQSAGYPFAGFRIFTNNTTTLTAVISNIQIWPGKVLPATLKVPALVKDYADSAAYLAISDLPARHRVHVWGDSTSHNYALPVTDNWPALLQGRSGDAARLLNHAFAGNVANTGDAQVAALNPVITVSGNAIPADLTPVAVTAYDIAPVMGFTASNPDLDNIWLVEGRKVRVSSTTFDGSQNPTALTLTPISPAAAPTPVPPGSKMMCVQGLQATNDFHIIWGWFNSSAQTITGMIPIVARVGMQNCLIMPALQALSSGPVNPYSAQMQAMWPGRVYDPNFAPTAPELAYLLATYGWSPDATDLTYIAANKIPPGLRMPSDNIHLNRMGGDLIARRVYNSPQYQAMLFGHTTPDARVGAVQMFASKPNARWLPCDGAVYTQAAYPALFGAIGAQPNIGSSTIATAGAGTVNTIEFGNALYMAFTTTGIYSASDPKATWTLRQAGNFNHGIWDGAQWIAVGAAGILYTSSDGLTWASQTSPSGGTAINFIMKASTHYLIQYGGTIASAATVTGTWTARATGKAFNVSRIAWSGTVLVAVDNLIPIYSTDDGVTWSNGSVSAAAGSPNSLYFPAYGNGLFVVFGLSGRALKSTDGINWTDNRQAGVTGSLQNCAVWDGEDWILPPPTTLFQLYASRDNFATPMRSIYRGVLDYVTALLVVGPVPLARNDLYIFPGAGTSGNILVVDKYSYNKATSFVAPLLTPILTGGSPGVERSYVYAGES